MRTLVLFVFALGLVGALSAQRIELLLVPFEEAGKWGYINHKDSVVVQPIFEEAYPTFDFRGRIRLKGKYGFINEEGKIVIKPKYDEAEDFMFGMAKVSKKGKSEYITTNGRINKEIIALCGGIYRRCIPERGLVGIDTFKVGNKYHMVINTPVREHGKLNYYPDTLKTSVDKISALGGQYVILENNGKQALLFDQRIYRSTEQVDTSLNFKYDEFKFFTCQKNHAQPHEIFGFRIDNKWGYIRLLHKPKEIIKPKYWSIQSMKRGIALVEYAEGKYGYVDQYGKEYFVRD
ncbi:MAG: WG repeat-containing protein [Bacteroidota bacterium]